MTNMIQPEVSHNEHESGDSVVIELLEGQVESLTQSLHTLYKPFAKRAAKSYWRSIKLQRDSLLAKAKDSPEDGPFDTRPPDERNQIIRENRRLFEGIYKELIKAKESFSDLPQASFDGTDIYPRIVVLTDRFFSITEDRWTRETWAAYLGAIERHEALLVREVWSSVVVLKLVLLQRICRYSDLPIETNQQQNPGSALHQMQACVKSLERLGEVDWNRFLLPLIPFNRVLCEDPSGAYGKMELTSRQMYHSRIEQLARRSDMSEVQIAQAAISMAKDAAERGNSNLRETHVGYYLVDDGTKLLTHHVGFHPGLMDRSRAALRKFPDEFYIGGIELVTAILVVAILVPHISARYSMTADFFALILMIFPASQSAVDLLNNLITRILPPASLPKMDFSRGVPAEFTTLVAIPTLLLDEKQIKNLVEDLEIRYLANHDPHIHFALLTDLADLSHRPKPGDPSPLVDLAVKLVNELNQRYHPTGKGIIFLLHRHRVFNQRQQVWMGWERKRGKLLDLNKLICEGEDAFPVKSWALPDIRSIRYVITLDSDTQLPRGAAHRLIGTMAHPLNQPVIDIKSRIVNKGFGILQPRVDISVHSANHSRLAALQSGETGVDPYSRAVSDAYQDLYGEGIFTGKGLYDVAVLHDVLNKRFPRNSLLSHDLIEGAYARAGLVSDIEVVDDYPSHYSAWSRRKHRWVRGDWQTVQWLLDRVPNEQGKYVKNPISLTSKWRIIDNLRRSLVEIATLSLLLAGWIGLPGGALYWTLCTLGVLFLPVYVQLLFSMLPAVLTLNLRNMRRAIRDCADAHTLVLLSLIFLPSQVLITLDAIFRATFRRIVSGERLLEWETAAQAELKSGTTPVDRYLRIIPIVAALLALFVYLHDHQTLVVAAPILILWTLTGPFILWLNAKPAPRYYKPSADQVLFLRNIALRTWRYFVEFSKRENHWLIPDNVREQDAYRTERVSPTNAGLLLNARQAALELGYLTCSEFVELTLRTLTTIERMPKFRGHLYNWHDNKTLEIMHPIMITTVDSGNLAASLISLRMGASELLTRPMITKQLLVGVRDHLQVLESHGIPWPGRMINLEDDGSNGMWLSTLLRLDTSMQLKLESAADADAHWWAGQTEGRLHAVREYIEQYHPWQMAEFEVLRQTVLRDLTAEMLEVTPLTAPALMEQICQRLQTALVSPDADVATQNRYQKLLDAIDVAKLHVAEFIAQLKQIDEHCRRMVQEMDFTFLLNPERELLSVGFSPEENKAESSCFDLLASEARTGVFIAVAKGDIPQQTWFRMGRLPVRAAGRTLMLSWTGTMFEYLMPTLWMRSYPDTTIFQSILAVVDVQRWFAQRYRIPWGISESAYSDTDSVGNYLYHAFGVPEIALKYGAEAGPVVSPYSSCLALEVNPAAALSNLKALQKIGCLGSYGFYEAADYRVSSASRRQPECTIVRSWMVHHQAMSLMAICNLLCDRVFQSWFHKSPMVQSTERLLYERP